MGGGNEPRNTNGPQSRYFAKKRVFDILTDSEDLIVFKPRRFHAKSSK